MADCRSCGQAVTWAITVPGDRKVPLDADVVPAGSRGALLLVDGKWAYSRKELAARISTARNIPVEEAELLADEYPAHLSHFATCPHADSHRRTTHG